MALADWTFLSGGLDVGAVDRGVTAGIPRPPGGGSFLFGFNSLVATEGAVGLFVNQAGFVPMVRGGSIRGCLQRGAGGATGFSPFLFLACQGSSINDVAYLLGLSDEDPHRIVLRKGSIAAGIRDAEAPGVLLRSGPSFVQGTWVHVRLDAIANPNGDVVLRVYQNDLAAHPLGSPPTWQSIQGMPLFVDDQLGINAGNQPLTSGRAGFGFSVRDVTRRAFFDHLEVLRQA